MKKFSEFLQEKELNESPFQTIGKIGSTISNFVNGEPSKPLSPTHQRVVNGQRFTSPAPHTPGFKQLLSNFSIERQNRLKDLHQNLVRKLAGKKTADTYGQQSPETQAASNKVIDHLGKVFDFRRLEDEATYSFNHYNDQ